MDSKFAVVIVYFDGDNVVYANFDLEGAKNFKEKVLRDDKWRSIREVLIATMGD